jgi:PAS domain S-box-containing protein
VRIEEYGGSVVDFPVTAEIREMGLDEVVRRLPAADLVMDDVAEAKRAKDDLAYYLGLLDSTDDAVVALDAGWLVTVWNKGAERMYGWTAEEVLGRHRTEFATFDMTDAERARMRDATAAEGLWRGEVVAYWRYTYVNDRALRRMRGFRGDEGLTREDVLGRGMWRCSRTPSTASCTTATWRRCASSGRWSSRPTTPRAASGSKPMSTRRTGGSRSTTGS